MDSQRKERIELVATTIRRRWGVKALDTLGTASPAAHVKSTSSGFAVLDKALGIGGIPQSCITEFVGNPTSGIVTIALKIIASAQANSSMAIYLDLSESLDADYADRCGVDLNTLLLIRPQPPERSLELLRDLVEKKAASVVVFDSLASLSQPRHKLTRALQLISRTLTESGCALIFLNPSPNQMLAQAAVRLSVQRKEWLKRHGDVYGYLSQITITKNKFALSGQKLVVSLDFEEVVLGDAA